MKVRIRTEINFNPHGYHEDSGVRQWFDSTLVTIAEIRGKIKVVELPAGATDMQVSRRSFASEDHAEQYIEDQYNAGEIVRVQITDIEEEITRREEFLTPPLKRHRVFYSSDEEAEKASMWIEENVKGVEDVEMIEAYDGASSEVSFRAPELSDDDQSVILERTGSQGGYSFNAEDY